MLQCTQSGCGGDRYECAPGQGIGGNGETGETGQTDNSASLLPTASQLPPGDEVEAKSEVLKEQGWGSGITNAIDDFWSTWSNITGQSGANKLLDCCIPDPLGTYLTIEDCAQQSICYDCATFDDPRYHCEVGAGTYDPVLNQSGNLCSQTTLGDCITNNWTCYMTSIECVRLGCEHDHETWVCNYSPDAEPDDGEVIGEQNWYGSSFRKPLNEWSVVPSLIPPCTQAGYMGYNSQQECEDATPCYSGETFCFIGSSKIKMFDGTEKRIDQVIEGDIVLNDKGTSSTVVGAQRHEDFHDKIYGFNGEDPFVTAEHPLLVEGDIWKSIDPTWFPEEFSHDGIERFQLEVGDKLIVGENKEAKVVTSIDEHKLEVAVYSLELDVVNTYYVNGYVSHNAFFRDERPLKEWVVDPTGQGQIDPLWPPIDRGCPCHDTPLTYDPMCCYKFGPSSPGGPTPPSPTGGSTYSCCQSNGTNAVNHTLCGVMNSVTWQLDGYPYGYLGCVVPTSATPIAGSTCTPQPWLTGPGGGSQQGCGGGINENPAGGPQGAPPQPGGGGGDGGELGTGDTKGEIKTQPRPEHAEKMTQWENEVSNNAGERVMFNTYGVDANPLFNGDSGTQYEYNIISGDISRIDGDTKTIIGNFMDTEDEPVKVQPTEKPVGEPTDQPIVEPVKTPDTPETPETKELREQVLRMKKLMGL